MNPLPFSFGPVDDWDPQGYGGDEEELEDELAKVGMSVKSDVDEDEDEAVKVEDADAEEDEDADADAEEDDGFEKNVLDPLAALDDLADQINKTEHETFRFRDFDE